MQEVESLSEIGYISLYYIQISMESKRAINPDPSFFCSDPRVYMHQGIHVSLDVLAPEILGLVGVFEDRFPPFPNQIRRKLLYKNPSKICLKVLKTYEPCYDKFVGRKQM